MVNKYCLFQCIKQACWSLINPVVQSSTKALCYISAYGLQARGGLWASRPYCGICQRKFYLAYMTTVISTDQSWLQIKVEVLFTKSKITGKGSDALAMSWDNEQCRTGHSSRQGSWCRHSWRKLVADSWRRTRTSSTPSTGQCCRQWQVLPPAHTSVHTQLHLHWTPRWGQMRKQMGNASHVSPQEQCSSCATGVMTMVSSLVWWVTSQDVNKLDAEVPCSYRQNFSCLPMELFPNRTKQPSGDKENSWGDMAKGSEVRLEGLWVGKTARCENSTLNTFPILTTAPISLCLPSWQEALFN